MKKQVSQFLADFEIESILEYPMDIRGANLQNEVVSEYDLSHALFEGCNLTNTEFVDCDLSYAIFLNCNMEASHVEGETATRGVIVNNTCTGMGIQSDRLDWLGGLED